MTLFNLTCPSCGGKLQIGEDLERFACGYCGSEQVVLRGGGVVQLRLVTDGLAQVQRGTDKTAAELTIQRLDREISEAQAGITSLQEDFKQANTAAFQAGIELMQKSNGFLAKYFNGEAIDALTKEQNRQIGICKDIESSISQLTAEIESKRQRRAEQRRIADS